MVDRLFHLRTGQRNEIADSLLGVVIIGVIDQPKNMEPKFGLFLGCKMLANNSIRHNRCYDAA